MFCPFVSSTDMYIDNDLIQLQLYITIVNILHYNVIKKIKTKINFFHSPPPSSSFIIRNYFYQSIMNHNNVLSSE